MKMMMVVVVVIIIIITHFISSIKYSRKRTLFVWFHFLIFFKDWLVFKHLQTDFFQTRYDDMDR